MNSLALATSNQTTNEELVMNQIESSLVDAARVGRRGFRAAGSRVAPWLMGALVITGCSAKAEGTAVDAGAGTLGPVVDAAVDGATGSADAASSDAGSEDAHTTDINVDGGPLSDATVSDAHGAGCVSALFGRYVLRNDGVLLGVDVSAQTPVLDDATGLPLANVVGVEDGSPHGCAVLANGTVSCWQTEANKGNSYGQLGNGTTTPDAKVYRATPVLTGPNAPLQNIVSLATGDTANTNASCAITRSGNVYCWGDLSWITHGGSRLASPFAQPVTTNGLDALAGVIQVSLGYDYSCALVQGASARETYCWGYNPSRNLGQGDATDRQYPTKVTGLTDPKEIAITRYWDYYNTTPIATSCALEGSNVRCWGGAAASGTGDLNALATVNGPTLVKLPDTTTTLPDVVDLEAGYAVFCALRANKTLWCWGTSAADYGVTNVKLLAVAGSGKQVSPRFLTDEGVYHIGTTPVTMKCGAL